jgi:hypothetical protein
VFSFKYRDATSDIQDLQKLIAHNEQLLSQATSAPPPANSNLYQSNGNNHANGGGRGGRSGSTNSAYNVAVPTVTAERKKALFGNQQPSLSNPNSSSSTASAPALALQPQVPASTNLAAPPTGESERDRRLRERLQQRQAALQKQQQQAPQSHGGTDMTAPVQLPPQLPRAFADGPQSGIDLKFYIIINSYCYPCKFLKTDISI